MLQLIIFICQACLLFLLVLLLIGNQFLNLKPDATIEYLVTLIPSILHRIEWFITKENKLRIKQANIKSSIKIS